MLKKNPLKIDVGAIYNNSPKYKSSRHPQHLSKGPYVIPKEKEIVFDIDMTDYDPIRRCCSGASICPKCWPLMKVACKILQHQLTQTFGFKNLLFVYSGRRGIHCWVCDKKAREYPASCRSALASFLQILKSSGGAGDNGACERKSITVYNNQVSNGQSKSQFVQKLEIFESSIQIIDQYFETFMLEQNWLSDENYMGVLGLIGFAKVRNEIIEKFKKVDDLRSRFHILVKDPPFRGVLVGVF